MMQTFEASWYGKCDPRELVIYLRNLADVIERNGLEGVTVELQHTQEPNEGGAGEQVPFTHTGSGSTWFHLRANPDAWCGLDPDDDHVTYGPHRG